MDKGGVLGNVLESIKEEVKEDLKVVSEQVGVAKKSARGRLSSGQKETKTVQTETDEERKKLLESMYEGNPMTEEQKKQQELEDEQKKQALRQRLHSEYYQRLTNPPRVQEERPAEKVEREKKEDRWELQKKETKKPKLSPAQAQFRGTGEVIKTPSG